MSGMFAHIDWERYAHQQLWHMVISADPSSMMTTANHLDDLAGHMADTAGQIKGIVQSLESHWTGQTADQAASALNRVFNWADQTASTASDIAYRMGRYAEVTNTARRIMPLPTLPTPPDGQAADPAAGQAETAAAAQAAKQDAVRVMRQYAAESADIYHGMPTFSTPPSFAGVSFPPPQPEPPQPPPSVPSPGHTDPPAGSTTTSSSAVPPSVTPAAASTTPADFAATPGAGSAVGWGYDPLGGSLGLAGPLAGGGSGTPGGDAGGPAALIPGSRAGSSLSTAEEESQLARTAAAEAEQQAGWEGFAPLGNGSGRAGNQDLTHRDRYTPAQDLFGDLPPAYPPVLGL